MNFRECLRYLEKIQNLGIKFGLDNVRSVLHELNDPHINQKFIQIAGSNGKGSVCAMISRIFTLHGYRCGLFTSPHLMRVEERIRIDGKPVSPEEFCSILTEIRRTIEDLIHKGILKHPPTYFEIMTLAALLYFHRQNVDLAVLEVGMGGRYDATSVVEPKVTAVTTVSLEHEKFLGKTPSLIAAEKAGIIKSNTPVISGVMDREARKTIREKAKAAGAPFKDVFAPEVQFKPAAGRKHTFSMNWQNRFFVFTPSLPGKHQGRNAAVAIAAALEMSRHLRPLDRELLKQGVSTTRWEGRLEVIRSHPAVILDGAHNEEGALALKAYLEENFSCPIILVFAVMQDKNIRRLGEILFPLARKIYVTRFGYYRAASPEAVFQAVPDFRSRIECESNPGKALQAALSEAGRDGVIVAAGSLYLIGTIKSIFRRIQAIKPKMGPGREPD